MAKLIAIASSDWHLHRFRNFDVDGSRLYISIKHAEFILKTAWDLGVPHLFCGDLVHTPKEIENETNTLVAKLFREYRMVPTLAVSGNHDMSEKNSFEKRSPSHLEFLTHVSDNFTLLDFKTFYGDDFRVTGVPYFNSNQELVEYIKTLKPNKGTFNILMLHTDLPGAKTPSGYEVGEATSMPTHIDTLFKGWDLVICGHIHKPQRLGKKVVMLGAPWHQDTGDIGTDMGYWEIYDDGTMKFKKILAPEFRYYEGEKPSDNFHYWVEKLSPRDNKEFQELYQGDFHIDNSRKTLAKRYLKTKGIQDKGRRALLINILNSVE